jgi:hypothetical protein
MDIMDSQDLQKFAEFVFQNSQIPSGEMVQKFQEFQKSQGKQSSK